MGLVVDVASFCILCFRVFLFSCKSVNVVVSSEWV